MRTITLIIVAFALLPIGAQSADAAPVSALFSLAQATPEERAAQKEKKAQERAEKKRQQKIASFEKGLKRSQDKWAKAKLHQKKSKDLEREQKSLMRLVEAMEKVDVAPAKIEESTASVNAFIASLKPKIAEAAKMNARKTIEGDAPEVVPFRGADKIEAQLPTWCEGVLHPKSKQWTGLVFPEHDITERGLDALLRVVVFSCQDPEFDKKQKWVQAWRQSVSNYYGLSKAENDLLMNTIAAGAREVATVGKALASAKKTFKAPEMKVGQDCENLKLLSQGTYEAQVNRRLERQLLGCSYNAEKGGNPRHGLSFPYWDIDLEKGLTSEMAKAALIHQRVSPLSDTDSNANKFTGYAMLSWMELDRSAFEKELSVLKLHPWKEFRAKAKFRQAQSEMKLQAEALKTMPKRVQAMYGSGPQKSVKQWEKDIVKARKVTDLVLALEDKMKPEFGGMKGCGKVLYKELAPWIKKKFKKNKGMPLEELSFDGLLGYQLAYGLTLCGKNDLDAPVMDSIFDYYLQRSGASRGRMLAAYQGIIDAYNAGVSQSASSGFKTSRGRGNASTNVLISTPTFSDVTPPPMGNGNVFKAMGLLSPGSNSQGVVRSVKRVGNDVKVIFKRESWQQPTYSCTETNKISHINRDGTISYRTNCKKTGTRTASHKPEPVLIPKWAAAKIKPGAKLMYMQYSNGDMPDRAWPVEVYSSKNAKVRSAVFGVGL